MVGEKASRLKLLVREDVLSSTEEFLSYQSASNVVVHSRRMPQATESKTVRL